MTAVDVTNSLIIVSNLKEADGFFSKLKGLIGKTGLEKGEGLWMAPCRAIHTIGMRFSIDLVFLDRDLIVRKAVKNLHPSRIVCCWDAIGVLELPIGTIERALIRVGDKIEIAS